MKILVAACHDRGFARDVNSRMPDEPISWKAFLARLRCAGGVHFCDLHDEASALELIDEPHVAVDETAMFVHTGEDDSQSRKVTTFARRHMLVSDLRAVS